MEPSRDDPADDLRPEYDLTQLRGAVRGKYARRLAHGDGYETTAGTLPDARNAVLKPEEVLAFHQRMWSDLQPKFRRCVLPIQASDGSRSGVIGTGTLFRVAEKSFLVSAHHVFTQATTNDYGLSLHDLCPDSDAPPLPLVGRVVFSAAYDVAVMELSPEIVAGLPNRTFLSVHEADRMSRRPAGGVFALFGYPSVQVTPRENLDLLIMPLGHFSNRFIGPNESFEDFDPRSHLLVDGERNGRQLDSTGRPLPGSLKGMSGCSIWHVYFPGLSLKHWTPDDVVIVGVQTGVYKNGTVIKGTRWSVVDQLIRKTYPELSGPLDLHIPMSGT